MLTQALPGHIHRFAFDMRAALLTLACLALAACAPSETDPQPTRQTVEEERPVPAELSFDQRVLEDRLEAIGDAFDGEVGIAVVEVSSEAEMHYRGHEFMPQQSVSKLWVSLTALDQADGGELDLSEPVLIRPEDLTVFHQPVRDIVLRDGYARSTLADLIEQALTRSDNTANDKILRRVGGPRAVEAMLADKGLTDIRFGRDERAKQSAIAGLEWRQAYSIGPAFFDARDKVDDRVRRQAFETYLADPEDGASALGIAHALAKLARGQLMSRTMSDRLLETLSETRSGPNRLKGAVPPAWEISHKTGTGQYFDGEQSGYNDVGLLTAPDGSRYAVAVMIGRTRVGIPASMAMMHEVVNAVVAYHEAIAPEAES